MRKNRIRITESDLHRIVKESVKRILRENEDFDDYEDNWDDDADDYSWRIDDIVSEFGDGPVVINGELGLWNGKHKIRPVECDDIEEAIYKCFGRDCELSDPNDLFIDDNGDVHVSACHHDGCNNFVISRI